MSSSPRQSTATSRRIHFTQKAVCALFLLAYFAYFSRDAFSVHFGPDDYANMALPWRLGATRMVFAQFMPWSGVYRPMAAFFYLPLLRFFGLNPLPYHIVLSVLLVVSVYLIYRFARLLGCSELTAGLVALLACYHAGLKPLNYDIAFIYDILCALFYFWALVYYVRVRQSGGPFRTRQVVLFLGVYLCALNSKEMAVTLPVVLLVYEWFYQRPLPLSWAALKRWFSGPGHVLLYACMLNVLFIYGRVWAPGALINSGGYRPEFSWARVLAFQIGAWSDWLEMWRRITGMDVLLVWLLLTYLAWRRNRPVLRFCWFFLLLTPLPIEFLEGRGGAMLYIPFAGLAVFVSVVFVDMANAIARFLSGEPFVGRLGRQLLLAIVILAGVIWWAQRNDDLNRSAIKKSMAELGSQAWDLVQQVRALNVGARPHSTVAILHDPFHGYELDFIFELWIRDRTVTIWLEREHPHTPAELARADYVFDYQGGRLIQVR